MKVPQNWPYILLVPHDAAFQIFLVTDRAVLTELSGCWEAVKCLFGAYFVFNMEYPQPGRALLKMSRYYNTTLCHYWDMSVK